MMATDAEVALDHELERARYEALDGALDLQATPFSRYGSYLAFTNLAADVALPPGIALRAGLYLRSLRGPLVGPSPWQPIFHLQLLVDGEPVQTEVTATPTRLRLVHGDRSVEICFETADRLRIWGRGAGLRLAMLPGGYNFALAQPEGRWQVVVCAAVETKFMLGPLVGEVAPQIAWSGLQATELVFDLLPAGSEGEWWIDEYTATWPAAQRAESFAAAQAAVDAEYAAWAADCRRMVGEQAAGSQDDGESADTALAAAVKYAAYVTWSCVVAPAGHLRRPAMYMSKNAMASIWSWDNCFNALALARHAPELAWDQLMVMVDLQDPSGVLPDLANDRFVSWSFCKPPVYGWALARLAQVPGLLTPARLAEIYAPLCRVTEWWFRHRDDNGDGMPQYNHGNECGWDNSTVFRALPPIDAPDLAAYLVIQTEFLAQAAAQLGRAEESRQWQVRSERLLEQMLGHFWRGDRFVARQSLTGEEIDCESLLLFVPLLLGRRLPQEVVAALVTRLRRPGHFLTAHGLASESTSSQYYEPDGYWRGPLWGAPMVMLVEGLAAVGQTELAADLRRRFCALVVNRGLAENYDAITGAPLRDRAFTWTASAFLLLAAELGQPGLAG
jgi:putative isomerase